MNIIAALFCGTLFGFGLALSGMTDTSRIIGFLDLSGAWDPTLAFVMGGALLVSLPFFQLGIGRMQGPFLDHTFRLPVSSDIDARLLAGAALFGTGWGLVGFCPGPAFSSLAYLDTDILIFVAALVAGIFLADLFDGLLTRHPVTSQ